MKLRREEIVIGILFLGTLAFMYSLTHVVRLIEASFLENTWIVKLSFNLLGYASIFIPGYLIFRYVRSTSYLDSTDSSCLLYLARMCINGSDPIIGVDNVSQNPYQRSAFHEAALILFCFFGLQLTYLTWGLMQEKVMTQEYVDKNGVTSHYKDSQFLVFVNRILAFALSVLYILVTKQRRHHAPLYKYVYCSFSNIMSSWCQYEALKYVSFPTQVLAKASKVIPVMMMGKIISKKKYEYYEYVTAGMISVGMIFFLSGNPEDRHGNTVTTVSGVLLLASYMVFDSFTSSWQGALFSQYNMSSVQMMCGVNLFSCLFTAVSIAQQNGFAHSFHFMSQFPKFIVDCLILSLCSAAGQLFIFFTIAQFGPVVFVIIMTIRQGLAILLSCIMYQHPVTALGIVGIIIVFISIFLRIYCNQRIRALRKRAQIASSIKE
ncbi:hypothetical protein R5R35_008551 [Gryllus longicercus]|uniref:Adenosine 3'-phospho 5'-phosphosulfate transporter 1 n=1 Tax=Gryllus longicercus TaxID=2509291 RepID=A0AAN9Z7X5_9ORTH